MGPSKLRLCIELTIAFIVIGIGLPFVAWPWFHDGMISHVIFTN